jgi:uncharacterized protein YheU (UPF0270 family)
MADVRHQLERGEVLIVFDVETESANVVLSDGVTR